MGRIPRPGERRERRARDADGAVPSVGIEGVLRPAVTDIRRADRCEFTEVFVHADRRT